MPNSLPHKPMWPSQALQRSKSTTTETVFYGFVSKFYVGSFLIETFDSGERFANASVMMLFGTYLELFNTKPSWNMQERNLVGGCAEMARTADCSESKIYRPDDTFSRATSIAFRLARSGFSVLVVEIKRFDSDSGLNATISLATLPAGSSSTTM